MSYRYPYDAEAITKEQVITAMNRKRMEALGEAARYETGLSKIANLEEGKTYQVVLLDDIVFIANCTMFRRDHIEFRIVSCSTTMEKVKNRTYYLKADGKTLSLPWDSQWTATPTEHVTIKRGHTPSWDTPEDHQGRNVEPHQAQVSFDVAAYMDEVK